MSSMALPQELHANLSTQTPVIPPMLHTLFHSTGTNAGSNAGLFRNKLDCECGGRNRIGWLMIRITTLSRLKKQTEHIDRSAVNSLKFSNFRQYTTIQLSTSSSSPTPQFPFLYSPPLHQFPGLTPPLSQHTRQKMFA